MSGPTTTWQCVNGCTMFETIAIPQRCPFCGSSELYPQRDGLRDWEVIDNEDTPTRFDDREE